MLFITLYPLRELDRDHDTHSLFLLSFVARTYQFEILMGSENGRCALHRVVSQPRVYYAELCVTRLACAMYYLFRRISTHTSILNSFRHAILRSTSRVTAVVSSRFAYARFSGRDTVKDLVFTTCFICIIYDHYSYISSLHIFFACPCEPDGVNRPHSYEVQCQGDNDNGLCPLVSFHSA